MSSPQDIPLLPVRVLLSEPALGKVRALAVDPAGDVLWAGADSGVVLEIGRPDGTVLRRIHAHKGGVNSVCLTEGRAATGGNDGHVRIWDRATLGCLLPLKAPGRRVYSVDLCASPPGRVSVLTFGGWRAEWDLAGRPTVEPFCLGLRVAEDVHRGVWPLIDERKLIHIESGAVWQMDLDSQMQFDAIPLPVACEPIARMSDRNHLYVAARLPDRKHILLVLDWASMAFAGPWRLPYGVACLACVPGEDHLYAGGNGRVFAIDLPSTSAASA